MFEAIFVVLLFVSVSVADPQLDGQNGNCDCVPYYQCKTDGFGNEDGEGIIDIRVGAAEDNRTAGQCGHYLQVCCLPRDLQPSQGGSPSNPTEPEGSGDGSEIPIVPPPSQGSHVNRGCGYRNPNGIGFRISGAENNEANFAEYPWMVAVLERTSNGSLYRCGASLIHPRVVLTAAHCVEGKVASNLFIRAGEWDTQTTNEGLPHQDRPVSLTVGHPQYKTGALHNDFALLILEQAVDLADNVETICLPEANEYFDNTNCFATGWGKSNFGDQGRYQVILKSVELPVVPHDPCQNALRGTRLGKYFRLDQSFLCAGGVAGIDTCTGDGGSPLVCPLQSDPSRYTQAGIVAWGIGCGTDGVPGVYADVAKARPWIDQTLASYNIDASSYSPGAILG